MILQTLSICALTSRLDVELELVLMLYTDFHLVKEIECYATVIVAPVFPQLMERIRKK